MTVTGEEDVVEYSYDTEYAKYLFDEVNKMRTANGVEPFVWNEEDAVYASKVKVGMHVQPDFDIYGITGVDENKETQDVQLVYGDDKDFTKEAALDALIQNSSCMIQLMKKDRSATDSRLCGSGVEGGWKNRKTRTYIYHRTIRK